MNSQRNSVLLLILSIVGVGMAMANIPDSKPRGVKNNSPGNIRKNPAFKWDGEVGADNAGFVRFKSAEYGFRAMAKLLMTYRKKYGLKTIEGIILRYAPPVENDSKGYAAFVGKKVGIHPRREMTDEEFTKKLPLILWAMSTMENGAGNYNYTQAKRGVAMAAT